MIHDSPSFTTILDHLWPSLTIIYLVVCTYLFIYIYIYLFVLPRSFCRDHHPPSWVILDPFSKPFLTPQHPRSKMTQDPRWPKMIQDPRWPKLQDDLYPFTTFSNRDATRGISTQRRSHTAPLQRSAPARRQLQCYGYFLVMYGLLAG